MRSINQFKVLYTIRDQQPISRAEIAKQIGLSPAAVSGITAELIEKKLLLEKQPGVSVGGRRPVLLTLNPDGAYTIGVFLSVRRINVVIINLQADILAEHSVYFSEEDTSPETVADQIMQAVHHCMWKTELTRAQISGIGVAIPGLVNEPDSVIKFALNYKWKNIHLKEILDQKLEIPTYIENSVKCIALAEQWFGEGKNTDDFIVVNLAQGIAIAIFINGQLYKGRSGVAGEFGHTIIDPNGPLCRCGKRGCFEAHTGNFVILQRAKELAQEGAWTTATPLEDLTIEEVIERVKSGEEALVKLYQEVGRAMGIGMVNLIEIFNPSKIILTGKGTLAGAALIKPMQETIPHYLTGNLDNLPEIVIQKWQYTDTARGAGVMVLQRIYQFTQERNSA